VLEAMPGGAGRHLVHHSAGTCHRASGCQAASRHGDDPLAARPGQSVTMLARNSFRGLLIIAARGRSWLNPPAISPAAPAARYIHGYGRPGRTATVSITAAR
jgi:hypothetical protein